MKFRNDIQGLRAIAVLFVFIFHLSNTFLPGGFVGVDIFFVISGYLISKIIISKMEKNNFSLIDFYVSRVKRIVPAYFFLLIITWIAFFFIFINADIGKFKLSHFWAGIFNSNYYFGTVDNYFGTSSSENPLLHTWTLGVEMQFYLFLPLLLFIKNRKILISILSILTIGLFTYSTYQIFYMNNKPEMYFSLLSRAPEFLIGVLISVLNIEKKSFVNTNSSFLSFLGVIGLLVSVLLYKESSPFPGILATLPCISVALILVTPQSPVNRFLSNKIFTYIGEISYSVYLWHWPIIAFFRYYYSRYDLTGLEIITITILTIVTALISYYGIEKPLRSAKKLKFYVPLTAMVVLNVLMLYFVTPLKFTYSPIPLEYIYPTYAKDSHSNTFQKVGLYGDTSFNEKNILLLGDSHAYSFVPYLDSFGKKEKIGFRVITNDSYPSLPGLTEKDIIEKQRWDIYKKLKPEIEKEVASADVILVMFTGDGSKLIKTVDNLLTSLKSNQNVLFIKDYPTLNINPVRINRDYVKNKSKKFNYKLTQVNYVSELKAIITKSPNAKIVDLTKGNSFFEDAPFFKDTLMYYDSNHLNFYGSTKYEENSSEEFMKYLNWALTE